VPLLSFSSLFSYIFTMSLYLQPLLSIIFFMPLFILLISLAHCLFMLPSPCHLIVHDGFFFLSKSVFF